MWMLGGMTYGYPVVDVCARLDLRSPKSDILFSKTCMVATDIET